jgi:hypothetical protein
MPTKEERQTGRVEKLTKVTTLTAQVMGTVSMIKTFCTNFPTLNVDLSIPMMDVADVIKFLLNMLGSLLGLQIPEIRDMLTQWLIKVMKPLEKEITFDLKTNLKSCFACKISPKIPDWMFTDGINIEVDQIDLTSMLKVNPDSEVGGLLYDSSSNKDMNRFLFDVIQDTPNEQPWTDPYNPDKTIATFKFVETGSFVGYDKNSDTGGGDTGQQNNDKRNNVINMKIDSSYQSKTFITFLNDYIDSQRPLFTSEKAIPQAMDFIYGVLSKKINLDEISLEKQAEFDQTVEDLIKCGVDDPNVILDDSFFEFDDKQVINIKRRVEERKRGIINLDNCGEEESLVDFHSVKDFSDRLKTEPNENKRVTIVNNGINQLSDVSSNNVSPQNKTKAKWQFIINLIDAIKITIIKMILSPKINILIITLFYLVNGQARFTSVRDFIKNIICLLREMIQKLLKKLIYELLLPLILKAITILLKCYIKFKVTQKKEQIKEQIASLTPFPDLLNKGLDKAFGVVEGAANSAIDVGVDSGESAIAKGNKNQTS